VIVKSFIFARLEQDINICLIKNGYPPTYSKAVFDKVMDQVENFEENL
jgi:type I restriction enzyme R subunit